MKPQLVIRPRRSRRPEAEGGGWQQGFVLLLKPPGAKATVLLEGTSYGPLLQAARGIAAYQAATALDDVILTQGL